MEILILLFLILLNGVFAMSEIAMVSSRKVRLEAAAKRGHSSAKKALELSRNPAKFLSTVQIGITLIGILTGIYSGDKIEDDLINYLDQYESLRPHSQGIAVFIIVVSLTFVSIILGEIVPKRIGLTMPERISRIFSFPMYMISVVAAPFIWLLTRTSDILLKILRIRPTGENRVTEEEIKAIIQEGTEHGAIEAIEQDIVGRVFSLGDRKVSSLMTHRSKTMLIRDDSDAEAIRQIVNGEMHSVYPVVNGKMEVVGILHLKELFRHINDRGFKLADHYKKPQYISENLSAYEALKLFKTSRTHQAIVIDEFGQLQGIVTLNDLLEALIGDASELYDTGFTFVQRADGSWLMDGQYPFDEFLDRFSLGNEMDAYPFNTISGLILHELRRIPVAGESITWRNFKVEVLDMDGTRIDKVLVKRLGET